MKKKQGIDNTFLENTSPLVQQYLPEYLDLFFSDATQPNSKLEKDCLKLVMHIAALGITKFLQEKQHTSSDNHEQQIKTAQFYEHYLQNHTLSTSFQEIMLFALLSSPENQDLQQEIVDLFVEKTGNGFDKTLILDRLESHLIQRCFAISEELNLEVSEVIIKLRHATDAIEKWALNPESPCQKPMMHEINELAANLFSTTLSDLLPPHVSHQQKLENLMSDHLPQLHTVHGINILNWNILTKNFFIGFADITHEKSVVETNEEYTKRLENIAHYLVEITNFFDIDIIALQEAYEDLYQYLPSEFRKQWDFIADRNWKIMFCKKQVWELDHSINLADRLEREFKRKKIQAVRPNEFQGYVLKNKITNDRISVYNVYTAHEDGPDNLEKAIHAIYELHQSETALSIMPTCILGDFNRRLQSEDIYAQDNATHLVPPMFRHITSPIKLYDYTDCCFEFSQTNIVQNTGVLLDTQNPGQIFNRPLLSLKHAMKDLHYTKVIFPMLHKIRLVDKTKKLYGSISIEEFKNRLETITRQDIQKMLIYKNRFGVLSIQLYFKKNIPLLEASGITGNSGYYNFKAVPHTTNHKNMRQASTKKQKDSLNIVQLIDSHDAVIDLPLPCFAQ